MNGKNNKMKKFKNYQVINSDVNPFDRQERIEWWSQKKLENAKVMIVGAGAIGNETLKNLALLGLKYFFIVDFDTISTSNLSRTVLFRKQDVGKQKAEVAAKRTKELALAEDVKINWLHGDIVWDLGTGIFKEMDIVLGCLDNVETRFAVNRQCRLAGTPWIDAGITELRLRVNTYLPKGACYQCGATSKQIEAIRKRYSCDDFKKKMFSEGKIPTVQIASAMVSALQVQEAVKLLCGEKMSSGRMIYYEGKHHDFDIVTIPENLECLAHVSYPHIIETEISSEDSLRTFLEFVSQESNSGKEAIADLDRPFVKSANCKSCNEKIIFYKPAFRIFDTDAICKSCKEQFKTQVGDLLKVETEQERLESFDLIRTEERVLNMSLNEIGFPLLQIIPVRDAEGNYKYYELTADKRVAFPNWEINKSIIQTTTS